MTKKRKKNKKKNGNNPSNERGIGQETPKQPKTPISNTPLILTLNQEKKHLQGEDSDPLLICKDNIGFIGVFDGMGGAGATEYTLSDGNKHTGAYLASREVSKAVYDFIEQNQSYDIDTTLLQQHIKGKLDKYATENNIKPTGLRSKMIRILPTTLAVIGYQQENDKINIYSYWSGDSRNYLLTKDGLVQISTDDLKSNQDPMENLRNDDALSNCICQDRDFTINKLQIESKQLPIIILSATDGCFGYLQSPMHFENMLLETLMQSNDTTEWKNNIIQTLTPVSGDDFSMSVIMLGLSFEDWKKSLLPRLEYIQKTYIQPIEEMRTEIENAKNKVIKSEKMLFDGTTELWNDYKTQYLNQQ